MPKKGTKLDLSEKEWERVKTEYITSEISYRNLATKYGITYTRLQKRGNDEDWKTQRGEYKKNLLNKSIDLICEEQAEQIARALRIGNTMLEKIEESLNEIDIMLVERTCKIKKTEMIDGEMADVERSTKEYDKKKVAIDRAGLKQLSAVLRDLKEIGIFRSELDKREQEARINKLRKDVEDDGKADTTINVVFADGIEEYGD